MLNTSEVKEIQGPGQLEFIRGVRRRGYLNYVGDLWQKYGDVFQLQLGKRVLIFAIHPDFVRYVNVTNRQNYDKLKSYNLVRRYLLGNGLIASTGELWRRQRKLMSPFYTPRGVQAYSEIMLQDGMRLVDRWDDLARTGRQVEMGEEMTFITASIILKAMFSSETMESIIHMKDAVETMIRFVSDRQGGFGLPAWLPTTRNRKYKAARQLVHSTIDTLIAQRRAIPEAQWPNDLLSRLMQARDEETGEVMSESLVRDESITTFFAGHETTARTMTAAWYALASNPEVADRLHRELDSVLGDRPPSVEDLHQLPYTLQVIKEVLRLYPPAPFYIRDAVGADQYDGYEVLAGASVMMSPYFTHRHPDFWENPLQFDPERWTPEREAARHSYAYHPFATGQRICIGNNFSLLESHILLALLARRFAPRLSSGYEPHWVMLGTLGTSNGFPMIIERR